MVPAVQVTNSADDGQTEGLPGQITASLWRSLSYFAAYRLAVAAVFLGTFIITGGSASFGSQDGGLFQGIAWTYLVVALTFVMVLWRVRRGFNVQLVLHVSCDVLAITGLMYASGGTKSGIVVMLMVVIAGAGLVGQGRLTFLFAAMATLAILAEQGLRDLYFGAEAQDFIRAAVTSTGFFAIAAIARMLGHRVVSNEVLAYRRGVELADQIGVNRQVIEDMADGVLVVNEADRVRLHNRQAEMLLAVDPPDGAHLVDWSPALAAHVARQRAMADVDEQFRFSCGSTAVLARMITPVVGGNTLIYLQDLSRIQAEARQIKLAALGRLTANMAHEIRNPLSAISHASELLVDEQRADTRGRLVRIICDNSSRLNRLVGEILELGRRDQAVPEVIQLEAFLKQFVDEYALQNAAIRDAVRIATDPGLTVTFDRTHFYRVLENLLTNALRYASGSSGSITVEAFAGEASLVDLHISDDGPGIAKDDRGKVFEPFFTTCSSGTGLGLYIARELCDANGASLELMDYDGGAHFRIRAKGQTWQSSSSVESVKT